MKISLQKSASISRKNACVHMNWKKQRGTGKNCKGRHQKGTIHGGGAGMSAGGICPEKSQ